MHPFIRHPIAHGCQLRFYEPRLSPCNNLFSLPVMCGGMAVASIYFFPSPWLRSLRTILLGADGPSPKAQGPELGQCCQDVLKFANQFMTAANLRPVGPRQLPQALQLSAQRSLEERRLQTLRCVSAKTVPKTQRNTVPKFFKAW